MRTSIKTAAIAAIVSLGVGASSATAASLITSKDIKNGTIKLVDMSASAKRALKGNQGPAGPMGAQGAPGAPGAAGIQGVAGGFDPAKVTYVQGAVVQIEPRETATGTATCPAGTKVLSGGWLVDSNNVGEVYGSRSAANGSSWVLTVFNWSEEFNATITPFAVCAAK